MRKVFISYRRQDSGRLADEIATVIRRSYGYDSTFIDKGDISAGSYWSKVLEKHLEGMVALICVIGPNWVGLTDGHRRIDDPQDWVRHENSCSNHYLI